MNWSPYYINMAFDDNNHDGQKGTGDQRENLADSIKLAAERDTRKKPWQSARDQYTASVMANEKKRPEQEINVEDDYCMPEGFVTASS